MPQQLSDKERIATMEAKVEAIMALDDRDRDWREEVIQKLTEIILNQSGFKDYQKIAEATMVAHEKRITSLENARKNFRLILTLFLLLATGVSGFIAWAVPIILSLVTHHA